MIKLLSYIGQRSSSVLILGLLLAALLPSVSSALRPALPLLVSLVLGLAIARLDVLGVMREFTELRRALLLLVVVLLFMPLTCVLLVWLWRLFNLDESGVLLLVVFAAAPPLSSATSLSLLLGFNARVTLQVTLLATLVSPVLSPLCFFLAGLNADIGMMVTALQIAMMIAGGFGFGLSIQAFFRKALIDRNAEAFNGIVALSMVLFLFPVFDGVVDHIRTAPLQSFMVLILAIILNLGGNLIVRWISQHYSTSQTASAFGLMFGNRNVSIYLAVLPFNPLLSIFVAASQIPMYLTPALFGHRKSK